MVAPLAGIKVLDLSRYIAGPHCAMLLGDLGAEVIKVEKAGSGDDIRQTTPRVKGESLYWMAFNRNKKSVTLNFRHAEAQDILRRMAGKADVLIQNFRPGVMDKMGCGWDVLHGLNERLIMVNVSGFGQTGPYAHRPGFDVIAQAMSGLMDLTGQPDGPPTMSGTFVVDILTAQYAAIGVLGALQARERTGQGQVVEVCLLESAVSALVSAIPDYLLNGRQAHRHGNRDIYVAPANSFQAGDGAWVHIVAATDPQFGRLAKAMDAEWTLADPRFATADARLENAGEIEALIAVWTKKHTADEVVDILDRATVPAAKIARISDVVTNPQLMHRKSIVEFDHPVSGRIPLQGLAFHLSETPTEVRLPPPVLGRHTREVLTGWLGMDEQEVARLERDGVV